MPVERQRPPTFYSVPAGTEGKPCRVPECDATIYMVPSQKSPGKFIPVDCGVLGGQAPTETAAGKGVNHYTTCTDPSRFRRPPEPKAHQASPQTELTVERRGPACIFCGCTNTNACRYVPGDLERLELEDQVGEPLLGSVSCYWLQLDPPVCSAPECRAKRATELPLPDARGQAEARLMGVREQLQRMLPYGPGASRYDAEIARVLHEEHERTVTALRTVEAALLRARHTWWDRAAIDRALDDALAALRDLGRSV